MGCLRSWVAPLIWGITALMIGVVMWLSPQYTEALWASGHLSRYHTDVTTCRSVMNPFRARLLRNAYPVIPGPILLRDLSLLSPVSMQTLFKRGASV